VIRNTESFLDWNRHFPLVFNAQAGSGANPVCTGASSPGLKRLEHEDAQPFSAEVKNTSTTLCVFMAWCLIKHMDNFAFTLYNETSEVGHTFTEPVKSY
jgi:hypothetical protein